MFFTKNRQIFLLFQPVLTLFEKISPQFPRAGLTGLLILTCVGHSRLPLHADQDSFAFSRAPSSDPTLQVVVHLKVSGKMRSAATNTPKVRETPLQVTGNFVYQQKFLESTKSSVTRSIRCYETAKATIQIAEHQFESTLAKNQFITHISEQGQSTLISPTGPLRREQLDLIDIPANSAFLHFLLPEHPVKIGESWPHDQTALAALLGIDVISQTDVQTELNSVDNNILTLVTSGVIDGSVEGVATDIKINVNSSFDITSQQFAASVWKIEENRSIGHAAPGFQVTAQVDIKLRPSKNRALLSERALKELPQHEVTYSLLQFTARRGGFGFLHARNWHVMVDQKEVTVLRFVQRGDLVAQCNLSRLPKQSKNQTFSLEKYQAEIATSLGENFGQFLETSQTTTEDGLEIMRIVASGQVADLTIHWIYYHLEDSQGRRISLVFTYEEKFTERFLGQDDSIIGSFEFFADQWESERTAANETTESATGR